MPTRDQLIDGATKLVVPPRSPADRRLFALWLGESLKLLKKSRSSFDIPREDVDAMIDDDSHGTAKADRLYLHAAVLDLLEHSVSAVPLHRRDATARAEDVIEGRARFAAFFSPGDDLKSAILAVIRGAREEILVQAWDLSCTEIGAELARAAAHRIEVAVSAPRGERLSSALRTLATQPRVRVLRHIDPKQKNHNKTIVIDGRLLLTGSVYFNYMSGRHDENLAITTVREMVAAYREDFESKRARLVSATA